MKKKKALITGVTGQVGSQLAEFLLGKGYEVHGMQTREWLGYEALVNIKHLVENPEVYKKTFFLHFGDMADGSSINRIMQEVVPDEIYNLAAQADVQESFFLPEMSIDVNGNGVTRLLEAMRRFARHARLYQASTSELFGDTEGVSPQNEDTRLNPQSPYAIGKYVGYQMIKVYRKAYGLYACNGFMFNHEGERRGDDYVTRKVTKAVAKIKLGLQKELRLGNLHAKRDWGYAKEYIEAQWLILQQPNPDDYVIGTGETHTVQEWVEAAFNHVGLDWKEYVVIDRSFFRPAEVDILKADASRAKEKLGWQPTTTFKKLVGIMVDHDLQEQKKRNNL